MREGIDQELSNKFAQELRVGGADRSLAWTVQRCSNLPRVDIEKHPGKEQSLKLKSYAFVSIDPKEIQKRHPPALWSASVSTKKISCKIGIKNCWKKADEVCASVSAMLLISSMHMLSPAASTSRLSCLLAHRHASMTNLNWRLSNLRRATKPN